MKTLAVLSLFALCGTVLLGARAAHAQAEKAGEQPDAKAAARAHFDRALAASNEQRFDEAALEFEEAYALAPDFKVLYNIGRVSVLLGRPLRAVEAFEAYLAEAGARISRERRDEVERLLDEQRPRLALLGVETQDGADIRVDGRLMGQAPLPQRVRVVAGAHTVEALIPERPPLLREITLVGASTTDVTLAFPPPATPPPADAPRVALTLERQPQATAPTEAPHPGRRLAGFVTGGVGLAALVAGAVVAYQGALDANDAKGRLVAAAMPAAPAMPDVAKYDVAKVSYDDAKTKNQLGWAVVGVGGLALITGATLVVTSPAAATTPHVVAGHGTIGLAGAW